MARTKQTAPTAGQRLIADLTKPDDPISLQFLIEEAGQTKDFLERLRPVLNGDRDAWLDVKIGAKTVEVVVTNPLVQYRQLSEQLRKLLVTIHSQRADVPPGPDPNDDLAGLT